MYHHMWFARVNEVLEEVFRAEESRIVDAGGILADTLAAGGLVYAFGSGHSHMMAEALFYRAGGLAAEYSPPCPGPVKTKTVWKIPFCITDSHRTKASLV